ncbi:aspartate dehydrogenase domain-containing protein [Mesorhizobium sp. ORM6]
MVASHEIEVHSAHGDAFMRFANRPAPANPKTLAIVAVSLVAEINRHPSANDTRNDR